MEKDGVASREVSKLVRSATKYQNIFSETFQKLRMFSLPLLSHTHSLAFDAEVDKKSIQQSEATIWWPTVTFIAERVAQWWTVGELSFDQMKSNVVNDGDAVDFFTTFDGFRIFDHQLAELFVWHDLKEGEEIGLMMKMRWRYKGLWWRYYKGLWWTFRGL